MLLPQCSLSFCAVLFTVNFAIATPPSVFVLFFSFLLSKVAALIAEQRYTEAIALAQEGEQPFASMSNLLQQWKTGVEREYVTKKTNWGGVCVCIHLRILLGG